MGHFLAVDVKHTAYPLHFKLPFCLSPSLSSSGVTISLFSYTRQSLLFDIPFSVLLMRFRGAVSVYFTFIVLLRGAWVIHFQTPLSPAKPFIFPAQLTSSLASHA